MEALHSLLVPSESASCCRRSHSEDFLPNLKDHILARLLGHVSDGIERSYTDDEHDSVEIICNRIYKHKAMRVNYTTYDMRREQDTINPRTRPDIMLLSYEDEGKSYHPYWYARALGIFHVNIKHNGPSSSNEEVHQNDCQGKPSVIRLGYDCFTDFVLDGKV